MPVPTCDWCGTTTTPDQGAFCDTCADNLTAELWDQRRAEWWAEA